MVSASGCGPENLGSIPSSHPICKNSLKRAVFTFRLENNLSLPRFGFRPHPCFARKYQKTNPNSPIQKTRFLRPRFLLNGSLIKRV